MAGSESEAQKCPKKPSELHELKKKSGKNVSKKSKNRSVNKETSHSDTPSTSWFQASVGVTGGEDKPLDAPEDGNLFSTSLNPQVQEALKQVIDLPARRLSRRQRASIGALAMTGKDVRWSDVKEMSKGSVLENAEGEEKEQKKRNHGDPQLTVFVGNLPPNTNKRTLRHIFRSCGSIESMRLRMHQRSPFLRTTNARDVTALRSTMRRESGGNQETCATRNGNKEALVLENPQELFGYVCFSDVDSYQKALEKDHTAVEDPLSGERFVLRVNRSDGTDALFPSKSSVFLGNVPRTTSEQKLFDFICEETQLKSLHHVRLVRDPNTGRGRGIGFASFRNTEDVSRALDLLNGKEFEGRALRVTRVKHNASERSRRQSDSHNSNTKSNQFSGQKRTRSISSPASYRDVSSHHKKSHLQWRKDGESDVPVWQGAVSKPTSSIQELPRKLRRVLGLPVDKDTGSSIPVTRNKSNPKAKSPSHPSPKKSVHKKRKGAGGGFLFG